VTLSIRERLDRARQQDYVTIRECALLVGVSERTVWRRLALAHLGTPVHSGRCTRVHRLTAVRYFLQLHPKAPLSTD